MSYTEFLGLKPGDVVAIVGSGGKTTLLWQLAAENRDRRVLVSTTTKMMCPTAEERAGIELLHGPIEGEKITAPDMDALRAASAEAELTLIECDGAKRLPLKGWADHEPVVPDFATVTIGVLPLWPLGHPVGEEIVHRVEAFCALTGAKLGDPVTSDHLIRVITHPDGLFRRARGRQILYLNHWPGGETP
ncbi:MAG: selenium cofactor biosynthesis protein YqeC [Oscillospiraceae bacterium]|nr:selenium cofactor biosynthesis protein YqeC [Oscillospiraceae bacterium]